jgi:hypothetical protein
MTTRRQALAGAVAGALALRAPVANAAGTDTPFLEALFAYQRAAVFAYDEALRSGAIDRGDRATLAGLRDQAAEAAAALRAAVVRNGGKPLAPPSTAPGPASGRAEELGAILAAEEAAVTGFYVSLQALADLKLVRGVAAFMAQAGRRLVVVRDLAGDPMLPRAFETGGA